VYVADQTAPPESQFTLFEVYKPDFVNPGVGTGGGLIFGGGGASGKFAYGSFAVTAP
jgi:hypothetical protein